MNDSTPGGLTPPGPLDFVVHFPTSTTWRFGDRTIVCSLIEGT